MDRSMVAEFVARDFVETQDGLVFAVVDSELEEGRLTAYLRYRREHGRLEKLETRQARAYLDCHASDFFFYSPSRDTWVQAVPLEEISNHYSPRAGLKEILTQASDDPLVERLRLWCHWITQRGIPLDQIGITGSVLLGAHGDGSDLDVVCYDRRVFHRLRQVLSELQSLGLMKPLSLAQWRAAYDRRSPALSFDEYLWHERRKGTKGLVEGTRLDLSLVVPSETPRMTTRKVGQVNIQAQVTDDTQAFDSPARWRVDHEIVREVICFTATYTGQAYQDEWLEAAGYLEMNDDGGFQLIVGASREAPEEFIRVLKH